MIYANLKISSRQIESIKRRLGNKSGRFKTVMNTAINQTASSGRTMVVKDLKAKMGKVKISTIKKRVQLQKSKKSKLGAEINILPKRISLIEFAWKTRRPKASAAGTVGKSRRKSRRRGGVNYDIGKGKKNMPRAFIATAKNSLQVWHRAPGDGPSGLVGRKPLMRLLGPSVGRVENKNRILRWKHIRAVNKTLKAKIEQKIQWQLNKS